MGQKKSGCFGGYSWEKPGNSLRSGEPSPGSVESCADIAHSMQSTVPGQ